MIQAIEEAYGGQGYGAFKEGLAEVVIETLRPIQERFKELRSDKREVERITAEGEWGYPCPDYPG